MFVPLAAVSVVIAEGKRPVSFRTRKLSPPAPMVLHSGGCGRVGRRRTQREQKARPGKPGRAFCISGANRKGNSAALDRVSDLLEKRRRVGDRAVREHGQG